MSRSKGSHQTTNGEWEYPMESQIQLIQMQLALVHEEREHSKRNYEERYHFLSELYGVSKTSIGLLIPLLVSTYAYPIVPNIETVRWFIVAAILSLTAIIYIYLRSLRLEIKNGEKLRKSRDELMLSILRHSASLLEIRNQELITGNKALKNKDKPRP